jgi:hypothetical protein
MFGGKNQASTRPTALGTMLQASTYGLTIPQIYGMTRSPFLAIWANNLRQGGSGKKGKASKKGGPPDYVEAIDFLLGHNPIMDMLQIWANSTKYGLDFVEVGYGGFAPASYTIADANFVALIAVTARISGYIAFDDYGGSPHVSPDADLWVPMWNELQAGPDPMDGMGYRCWPFVYRWQPSYGNTFYVDPALYGTAIGTGQLKIYYARTNAATSYQLPAAKLRLSFENILGSGDEYAGYSSEQIQYPWYAGAGSPNIDLGSSGAIPSIKAEILGKWAVYPSGDGDFVDMIADIIKSGQSQAAIGGATGVSPVQRGTNCYNFPGAIQKKLVLDGRNLASKTYAFDQPNTAGNLLLLVANCYGGDVTSVTDSLGNTGWTLAANVAPAGTDLGSMSVWYCENCLPGANSVTIDPLIGGGKGVSWTALMEIAGADTFDAVASASGVQPSVSLTTTNDPGKISLMFSVSLQGNPYAYSLAALETWPLIVSIFDQQYTAGWPCPLVQQRTVTTPGTYAMQWPSAMVNAHSMLILIAFKATVPPTYAKALPDIIDRTMLDLTRQQCRAGGLWGSLTMDSQQEARNWVDTLCQAANCAPVWSGFKLKLIPRSEVSAAANGGIYYSPTASGPVANLSTENGDFVAASGESPISVVRAARTDVKTVLQMQHINRSSDYAQMTVAEPDAAGIALYGVRKGDPIVNNAVQEVSVARALLRIAVRRQGYVENMLYKFTLNARWQLLEAMDLVTISDPLMSINLLPVRLTKAEQNDQTAIDCEAEPFVYGINAPQAITVTAPNPYSPSTDASAGNVNTPVIFEPVARLSSNLNQIWFVVSSPSAGYGGCQVYVSTDGGASYNLLGVCQGNATTGVTTLDWPAAADPDTTNDLPVDLTESLGSLLAYAVSDEDNFTYPCYVAGGTALTPYELMTYAAWTLTSSYNYTLAATGGGTNKLRRAVFGAPGAAGVDHPLGSRFAFLGASEGILKVAMDPNWIGKTLYFKFPSFNTFGGGVQSLSDAAPYAYAPVGTGNSANLNALSYTQTPASALTNPTATSIVMAAVAEAFPTNTASYQGRSFTIGAPGVPTTYYVTVHDPGYVGDAGSTSPLTSYCETTQAKIGLTGYVFIGAIQALPAGGGSNVIPGGYPLPQGWLINGA